MWGVVGGWFAQGVRLVVAAFENERGDVAELTDVPASVSECFVQKHTQTALQGRASPPGLYEAEAVAGGAPAGRHPTWLRRGSASR